MSASTCHIRGPQRLIYTKREIFRQIALIAPKKKITTLLFATIDLTFLEGLGYFFRARLIRGTRLILRVWSEYPAILLNRYIQLEDPDLKTLHQTSLCLWLIRYSHGFSWCRVSLPTLSSPWSLQPLFSVLRRSVIMVSGL